jgi:DNA mismatch endonuclease, patch repair protein
MADHLSPEKRSAIMSAIRATNTKPELLVRRMLHGLGYRFRTHVKGLAGKPDLVFSRRRKVIFVHGCFWHQHHHVSCRDSKLPTSNLEYWLPKLQRTRERDCERQQALERSGWQVLVLWECELRDIGTIKQGLVDFLGPSRWRT